jgi:glutamate transport system permease protein
MDVIFDNMDVFLRGFGGTLTLLGLTMLFALPFGLVLAAMRVSPIASLRVTSTAYVELLRNTPLLLVFTFFSVIITYISGALPFMVAAVFALTFYTAPFFAEAIRSGINSVPVGQAEAARSIGMTFGQTLGTVVMPQAVRSVIPPLINVVIALTKNTSVAGAFFIFELFNTGRQVANANGNAVVAVFIGVAFFYLIITVPLGQLADYIEKRVAVKR